MDQLTTYLCFAVASIFGYRIGKKNFQQQEEDGLEASVLKLE